MLSSRPRRTIASCSVFSRTAKRFEGAATRFRLVHLPVIPAPHAARRFKTHSGNRIIQIALQRGQKFRIVGEAAEVLIENARRAPTRARIGRCQRGGQLIASLGRCVLCRDRTMRSA